MFLGKMLMDYSLFFLIAILAKTAEGSTCRSKDVVTLGKRLSKTGFVTFHQIKLMECARKCMVRKKCKSFNYERNLKICELNSENKTTTTIIKANDYLYGEPSDWPTELIGACADVNCPKNSMCIELIKGHVCVKSDCDDPPRRTHANVNSGCSVIGCRRTYACFSGYVLTGNDVAVCGSNGEWIQLAFNCTKIMINVALARNASQSSTFGNSTKFQASNAVDGATNCEMMAHTATGDTNRWWLVDFEKTAVVEAISILNRDACGKRLANITILIGSSLDTMELCAYYKGPGTSGETVGVKCSLPMPGRYLKLTGGGTDTTCGIEYVLQFCEIEVMGYFPE